MFSRTEEEASLSTILDEEQRGELTLLLATVMSAMRSTLVSSFDENVRWSLQFFPFFDSGYA